MTRPSLEFSVSDLQMICEDARERLYEKYDPWASKALELSEALLEQLLLASYTEKDLRDDQGPENEILMSPEDLRAFMDGDEC